METPKLGKTSQTWLKCFRALMKSYPYRGALQKCCMSADLTQKGHATGLTTLSENAALCLDGGIDGIFFNM